MLGRCLAVPATAGILLLTACSPVAAHPATEFTSSALYSGKTCHARHINESDPQAWLPDPTCTPGAANPAVTIGMICPVAHTKQWRPPVSYTNNLKSQQLAAYDYVDSRGDHPQTAASTEEDHLIPLALGGAPRDPRNLWPEVHPSFNEKDGVESAAHDAVCRGALTLPQAQQGIALNWIALGQRLGVKN